MTKHGHAVDSFSFSLSSRLFAEREGCLTCVSLTQNCCDVGARCALACDVLTVSPHNGHQYVGRHGDSQTVKWEYRFFPDSELQLPW